MRAEPKFDAVRTMRKIRDRLSNRFKNMSFEQQKTYIKKKVKPKIKVRG